MRIIFVRHGESEGNLQGKIQGREDYCLSPSGVRQAKKLKNYFYNQKLVISHLYSSPLKRAFETAKILSELWEIEIKAEPGLQEYDMGRLSGADKETLEEKIPEANSANSSLCFLFQPKNNAKGPIEEDNNSLYSTCLRSSIHF